MKCPMHCAICPGSEMSIFSGLAAAKLKLIEPLQTTNAYKKGQVIFYEGNPALGVYCVSEGKVKLYKSTEDGKQRILHISGRGALLGYASLFDSQPEQYSAEVIEDAKICFMEKNGFLGFLKRNPEVVMTILARLSKETIKSHEQLVDQTFKSVRRRLAETLLQLEARFGEAHPKGTMINLALSRDELSQVIGATMETTVRLISEFKQEGLIDEDDRRIVVIKSAGLTQLSGPSF